MVNPNLVSFAQWIDGIEDYAHLLFAGLAVYYFWLMLKGGDEGRRGAKAWGLGVKGGKKLWGGTKKLGRKVGRLFRKTEKLALVEYVDLEELKKAVERVPDTATDVELKRAVSSKVRRAKRHEARAWKRFHQLENSVNDALKGVEDTYSLAGIPASDVKKKVKKILQKMEVNTSTIVAEIKKFDDKIDETGPTVSTKKKSMLGFLSLAISADQSFEAGIKELKKALGE